MAEGTTVEPAGSRAFALDRAEFVLALARAPRENGPRAAVVVTLPAPAGGFERFALEETFLMPPELARLHPEIKTYRGVGLDDPAATIRADIGPLGFHASVRSPGGAWYVEPARVGTAGPYFSYFGRDSGASRGLFAAIENDLAALEDAAALKPSGTAVAPGSAVTLRTYRLALVSNPAYAEYFDYTANPANVTAAKVALVNRINQIFEEEAAIRFVLAAGSDALNLNTATQATGPNGPCGSAPCFEPSHFSTCGVPAVRRASSVLGLLVGASNYDVGHLLLGTTAPGSGGGMSAGIGTVGGPYKGWACSGAQQPVGDRYALLLAHELGHQLGASHSFNGVQGSCANRAPEGAVEPGSGSSIMSYAGSCVPGDMLQPYADPYFSQRSYEQISATIAAAPGSDDEEQTVALRGFDASGDSFKVTYGAATSVPIVRGTNYDPNAIEAAIETIVPGASVEIFDLYSADAALEDDGFTVLFGGTVSGTNLGSLGLTETTGGVTGFVGERVQGGPRENGGSTSVVTSNRAPVPSAPAGYTIPLRTPFTLTAAASDPDGDALTYSWEQTDLGGSSGTALVSNTKTDGPLFRIFGSSDQDAFDPDAYDSPGLNAPGTSPARTFPDLAQIVAGNTNAATGTCPTDYECFGEFLPTADWVGTGDRKLHFRVTVRDGQRGLASADTVVTLDPAAGPFLVTSHGDEDGVVHRGGTVETLTWDVAGTNAAPISASHVKISMSTDGGLTFPGVLAASTPNDGSHGVSLSNEPLQDVRFKVEALGNVFFDLSDDSFDIQARPVVSAADVTLKQGAASPSTATIWMTDADSEGPGLGLELAGLPPGLFLTTVSRSGAGVLPGAVSLRLEGQTGAAPGDYLVTATGMDGMPGDGFDTFTLRIRPADPLNTTITRTTISQAKNSATFRFTATGGLAPRSFQCRLTGRKTTSAQRLWRACTSPKAHGGLRPGSYRFEVRAKDAHGVDPTPAAKAFTIR